MNKIKQILSLFTCLMILLSVAVLRSNKIWGNQLGGEKTEVADSLSAGPIVTADDGSMVVNTASLGKDIQGFAGTVPLEFTVRNGVWRASGLSTIRRHPLSLPMPPHYLISGRVRP